MLDTVTALRVRALALGMGNGRGLRGSVSIEGFSDDTVSYDCLTIQQYV